MGICSSYDSTTVVAAAAGEAATTVKLILLDGRLQEFARPVRAAYVLQKDPSCFVCNADDMEFEDFVEPVNAEDELQPGQLYFLLPVSMLQRRLHADEMAALAVKASAALMGGCQCRRGAAPGGQHLVFPDAAAAGKGGAAERLATTAQERRRRRRPGSRRGRDFKSALTGIPE